MPRRVNLPGADELFRNTAASRTSEAAPVDAGADRSDGPGRSPEVAPDDTAPHGGSGRIKHDEKMTVYVTSQELFDIEQARIQLRRSLGRNVDRGRLVRAALAVALADLDERGADSDVAERLRSP